jgi:hypothetical protein
MTAEIIPIEPGQVMLPRNIEKPTPTHSNRSEGISKIVINQE